MEEEVKKRGGREREGRAEQTNDIMSTRGDKQRTTRGGGRVEIGGGRGKGGRKRHRLGRRRGRGGRRKVL